MLKLALPLILTSLFAMPVGPRDMGSRLRVLLSPKVAREIGLSEDEKAKIKDIMYAHQRDVSRIRRRPGSTR